MMKKPARQPYGLLSRAGSQGALGAIVCGLQGTDGNEDKQMASDFLDQTLEFGARFMGRLALHDQIEPAVEVPLVCFEGGGGLRNEIAVHIKIANRNMLIARPVSERLR